MSTKILCTLVVVLVTGLTAVALACGPRTSAPAFSAGLNAVVSAQTKQQYPVSGEINRSYELSPNAQIDVSAIEGAVNVETTNSNRAEIHFVRRARTQKDFDCETIEVQNSPNSLTIEHRTDATCHIIQAYEELTLVVPQSANLSFGRIEGDFTVGKTAGYLQLHNIEGSVRAGEVQAAQIEAVEGDVTLHIRQVDSQGITVRGVEGEVSVRVANDVNANLRLQRVEGNIAVDLPNAPPVKRNGANSFRSDDDEDSSSRRGGYSLQLGSGGANLLISGIEGSVSVRSL